VINSFFSSCSEVLRPLNVRGSDPKKLATAALLLAAVGGQVFGGQPRSFDPPDLASFLLVGEEQADGDGDGFKETHILRYMSSSGDRVFSMSTRNRLWAWSLESHGDAGGQDADRNYVIRDSDCDGIFDQRYGLDEEFLVPDCLRK
jgi:hypothetical protein